ncbi:lineage-specific thermal regulator protein [Botrimarina colliarenosi]|uniref:Lineage-specific thermal regulator protein n=1 Tax=Botrimarina colliarenosi TaxID=2528001 RepID=A0A5C6A941_9BACT|nr:PadR family transcriptional regulator [Botrimarina colliarenosi]TWT95946.1 lineage-specific thermal regulator protein [Botrimarina colliarenosi]
MAAKLDSSLPQAPLPQGSLDLLVLQTLDGGKKHGYQIARHIQLTSGDVLRVEEGSLYPALHRMERRGWIAAEWGVSDANRRAKYYGLTRTGRAQLKTEVASWRAMVEAIGAVIDAGKVTPRAGFQIT